MSPRARLAGWAVMALSLVVALTIGVVQGRGPRTQQDRVDAIARTVKCPQCTSESVFESRTLAAEDLRREIATQVEQGRSDDAIRGAIADRYGEDILLTPPAGGVGALVWVVPPVVGVLAIAGLVAAFVRWRRLAAPVAPTEADRELVARARAGARAAHEPVAPARAGARADYQLTIPAGAADEDASRSP